MRVAALLLSALLLGALGETRVGGETVDGPEPAWRQWGGPTRDFKAQASGLAGSWPEDGPETLWSRPLGEGHSAILYEHGRLYTMYRAGDREAVICLDATSGETLWEHRYEAVYRGLRQYGIGPRSTPLLVGDLLVSVGVMGQMHALDTRDGSVVWSRDLLSEEFGGSTLGHGFASSPIAYGDTVIVQIGGEKGALVAFDQQSGGVRWRSGRGKNTYSSPRIVRIAGEEQLVVFMAEELIGLDPATGEPRWSWPHANQWGHNITMPAVDGDTIFISSPQAGARGLRLVPEGDGIEVEQIWSSRRIQLYHATIVQNGEWVYGSTGTVAPAFMIAVNIRTGELAWRLRGFAKANCLEADGRLLILDENGVLYLADASPQELVVRAKAKVLDRYAWTVPTIVGRTLYARDEGRILAVDLG